MLLLLFMLGLEHTGGELKESLRAGFVAGVVDFVLNFTPGLVAGFLVGWRPLAAVSPQMMLSPSPFLGCA